MPELSSMLFWYVVFQLTAICANVAPNVPLRSSQLSDEILPWFTSFWQLGKRVIEFNLQYGPHGDGELKIIAVIEDTTVIAKTLDHLGLHRSHLHYPVYASLAVQPNISSLRNPCSALNSGTDFPAARS